MNVSVTDFFPTIYSPTILLFAIKHYAHALDTSSGENTDSLRVFFFLDWTVLLKHRPALRCIAPPPLKTPLWHFNPTIRIDNSIRVHSSFAERYSVRIASVFNDSFSVYNQLETSHKTYSDRFTDVAFGRSRVYRYTDTERYKKYYCHECGSKKELNQVIQTVLCTIR